MPSGYVDTSAFVAILFDEPVRPRVARALAGLDSAYASNLLEAELRSVAHREQIDQGSVQAVLRALRWIQPAGSVEPQLLRVLACGYLRGADLWHLACALYVTPDPHGTRFVSLDTGQRRIAAKLGFTIAP